MATKLDSFRMKNFKLIGIYYDKYNQEKIGRLL